MAAFGADLILLNMYDVFTKFIYGMEEDKNPREFGLSNKRVGSDIHHLGDASFGHMTDPENLIALSMCIRRKRHTCFRMATSLNR